jgi:ribosomal protein S26
MTLCSKKPRHGKPIACHRARQGIAHDKAIKAKAWQALPIACHRAGQGIAHGKAIKAKACQALPIACHRAGQGIAHGKAIKAKASGRQGMESRLLVTGQINASINMILAKLSKKSCLVTILWDFRKVNFLSFYIFIFTRF